MRIVLRLFAIITTTLAILVFIEWQNRSEFEIPSSDINAYVIDWHSAYYDTMEAWDVNNGSVILKVDYGNASLEQDESVSKILLSGLATFTDGTKERFSKFCERKWSTKLDVLPDIAVNSMSDVTSNDPICFIILDHSLPYKRKAGSKTVSESDEQSRVFSEVVKTRISNFSITVWARKKPTKLERDIRRQIAVSAAWLKTPFER